MIDSNSKEEEGVKKGASNYAKILHVGLTAVVELLDRVAV